MGASRLAAARARTVDCGPEVSLVGSNRAELPLVPVPDNPNAVVFPVDARTRAPGRTWASLARDVIGATRGFHAACGLVVHAGWAWRVALDRKNRRHVQLLLWVVFDGPSTGEQFDLLERDVRSAIPGAGAGCIERVPVNGAGVVVWKDGVAHWPWHPPTERGGEPHAVSLQWAEDHLRAVELTPSRATADDVPEELVPILVTEPEYGEAQIEDERLRLAFAMHHTNAIVAADGIVQDRESTFVSNLFPTDLVRALGLESDDARARAFASAKTELPKRLGHHDKLALIGLFFSACYSDGTLDAREMRVLKDAGEQLGLTKEEVVKYLRRFW